MDTMFWPRPEKVVQRKSTLFQNIYQSLNKVWVFFLGKMHFSAERDNGHISVIPAQTIPPSFIENGPKLKVKLRVLIIVKWHKPETAKNRGEPRKMTHCSETNFFSVWSEWESCSPGILLTKIAIPKQKIDFWPQISKFSGQKSASSSLAANWSLTGQCFVHKKGVSLMQGYEDAKSFTPSPKKMDFWPKSGLIWQKKNWHFWPNIGIFGPFDPMPDQKTMRTRCLGGFSVMWVPKLLLYPIKIGIFGPKTANLVPCWWVDGWLWRAGCILQDTYLL